MFCKSLTSGWVDISSSDPTDMSSAEALASELSEAVGNLFRFLDATFRAAEGFAQSGTGYSRSN